MIFTVIILGKNNLFETIQLLEKIYIKKISSLFTRELQCRALSRADLGPTGCSFKFTLETQFDNYLKFLKRMYRKNLNEVSHGTVQGTAVIPLNDALECIGAILKLHLGSQTDESSLRGQNYLAGHPLYRERNRSCYNRTSNSLQSPTVYRQ